MKLSRSDYRRARFYRLLALITYSQHIILPIPTVLPYVKHLLGICKITLTKACKTFVLIEEFA